MSPQGRSPRAIGMLLAIGLAAPLCDDSVANAFLAPIDRVQANGFERSCTAPARKIHFEGASGDLLEGWLWLSMCTASTSSPAVVLMHGCSGLYGPSGYGDSENVQSHIRAWAQALSDNGMHALAIDSFSTRDAQHPPGGARQDYCGDRPAVELIGAREEIDRPVDASNAALALANLPQQAEDQSIDSNRIGVLGWSHGGSAALAISASLDSPFEVSEAFYPGCGLYGAFGNPSAGSSTYVARIPLGLNVGTSDTVTPPSLCEPHIDASSERGGAPVDYRSYENAKHGFDRANCVLSELGSITSPTNGRRYECFGTSDGEGFDLDDWWAKLDADRRSLCRLREALGVGVPAACLALATP